MSEPTLNLDGLSLSDEGLTLNLDSDSSNIQILDHCLIGRVLTDKQIRFSYFKERLSHFWKPGKKVSILQSGEGRFLFQFNHRLDAAKVLDEGPWLFDNFTMVIERIAPGVVPASVELNHVDIWLQVHHLPFGFIQPKVGQAIGRFLGELKEYDHRNTVHSSYMRLKVRINVNNPLQQRWKVRANEGNYVQISFKYEKLGIFCYLCGVLGHTDKNCPKLFDLEYDDGTREWGENLRPLANRIGTAATNKYLKDPIPSSPQVSSQMGASHQFAAAAAHNTTHTPAAPVVGNLDGRIIAVQREISAIKSGILSAQKQAMVKSGKNLNIASASNNLMVLSATPSSVVDFNFQNQPVVQGLLAETPPSTLGEDNSGLKNTDLDDEGVELKKRKRAKATSGDKAADNMNIGAEGLDTICTSLGMGMNDVLSFHDNPMYDVTEATDVTAGPDDQACREL
jgi:14-3-3 protein epsilon